jgi:hypothetical protein
MLSKQRSAVQGLLFTAFLALKFRAPRVLRRVTRAELWKLVLEGANVKQRVNRPALKQWSMS